MNPIDENLHPNSHPQLNPSQLNFLLHTQQGGSHGMAQLALSNNVSYLYMWCSLGNKNNFEFISSLFNSSYNLHTAVSISAYINLV